MRCGATAFRSLCRGRTVGGRSYGVLMASDEPLTGPPADAGGPGAHERCAVAALLAQGSAQVRVLQTAPTLTLSDAQLRAALVAATELVHQVDAARRHLVAALDQRPGAVPGAPTGTGAAPFLVHALRMDPGAAGREVNWPAVSTRTGAW